MEGISIFQLIYGWYVKIEEQEKAVDWIQWLISNMIIRLSREVGDLNFDTWG